jgi:stage II sporulation protein D
MKKFILNLFFVIACINSIKAQQLKVHVFSDVKATTMIFAIEQGTYTLYGDQREIMLVDKDVALYVNVQGTKVKVRTNTRELGVFSKIWMNAENESSVFKLLPFRTDHKEKSYPGNLQIVSAGSTLKCINEVGIEQYLPGVVAAEAGSEQKVEYYKIQAIISRTYVLKNIDKHVKQWYNVCDKEHCQVYKGLNKGVPNIDEGVESTKGIILVDTDLNYISAVFHSNCGGHTVNSEDVWQSEKKYLKGVPDTFCINMPHANWNLALPKKEWLGYLSKNYEFPIHDSLHADYAINFIPQSRETHFISPGYSVPLKYVRRDWKLRSTFFAVREDQDHVKIYGRGFGHGVGLCQEGAMGMVNNDYPYYDILHYYFKEVYLINESLLDELRAKKY